MIIFYHKSFHSTLNMMHHHRNRNPIKHVYHTCVSAIKSTKHSVSKVCLLLNIHCDFKNKVKLVKHIFFQHLNLL